MTIRVAINGYGRIGRNVLRAFYEGGRRHPISIVAVNAPRGSPEANAHLTRYDSLQGPFPHEIAVDGDRNGKPIGSKCETEKCGATAYVRAGAGDAEYFDPTMHEAPLRRIAEETGGRFYTPDNVAGLAEDVRYAGRGVTSVEERELWNMPIVLIALMGLVCAEWGYRRAVGLS